MCKSQASSVENIHRLVTYNINNIFKLSPKINTILTTAICSLNKFDARLQLSAFSYQELMILSLTISNLTYKNTTV